MFHNITKHKIILLSVLLAATAAVWLAVRIKPATEDDMRRSACLVSGNSYLCLVSGQDTVVLRADTVRQQGVWINRHWWWPSCDGRVLTVAGGTDVIMTFADAESLYSFIETKADSINRLLHHKETEQKELAYYLRSHGVIDEGYTQIATYATSQAQETDSLRRRMARLEKLLAQSNGQQGKSTGTKDLELLRKGIYRVEWVDGDGKMQQVGCLPLITEAQSHSRPVVLHTFRSTKPWGVYAVRNVPWGAARHSSVITVTLSPSDTVTAHHSLLAKGKVKATAKGRYIHNMPKLFAPDGAPAFTMHGRFIGIIAGKEVRQ